MYLLFWPQQILGGQPFVFPSFPILPNPTCSILTTQMIPVQSIIISRKLKTLHSVDVALASTRSTFDLV